jgi:hypothetical protein
MADNDASKTAVADEWDYKPAAKQSDEEWDYKPAPKPINQGSIGPTPSLGHSGPLDTIENYTREGRAQHPILSRIGDVTRGTRDFIKLAGGTAMALLPGEEGPAVAKAGQVAEEAAPVAAKAAEQAPVIAKPAAPPAVQPQFAKEAVRPPEMASPPVTSGNTPLAGGQGVIVRPPKGLLPQAVEPQPFSAGPKTAGQEQPMLVSKPSPAPRPAPVQAPQPKVQTPMQTILNAIDRQSGVAPLDKTKPLIQQVGKKSSAGGSFTEAAQQVDPIKEKYPDPAERQMVRANGERMYEAAKGDPATLKGIHDLTRVDLRQALINAGEDVGQTTVSNSKFSGEGSIGREQAFNRLLDKGYSPKQIIALAKEQPLAK